MLNVFYKFMYTANYIKVSIMLNLINQSIIYINQKKHMKKQGGYEN